MTKHKHSAKKVGVTSSTAPSTRSSKSSQDTKSSQGTQSSRGAQSQMKSKVETMGVAHLLDEAKTMAHDVGEYAMKAEKKIAKAGGSVLDHVVANPIPYAMIGVGAAWLAIGASASRRETISNAATWLKDTTSNFIDGAGQQAGSIAKGASTQVKNVSKSVGSAYEEHPFAFGAAVFAATTAIALALPRSDRENALMGGARDLIKDKVSTFSHESFDKAQNFAERIFDASTALMDGGNSSSSKRSRTASA